MAYILIQLHTMVRKPSAILGSLSLCFNDTFNIVVTSIDSRITYFSIIHKYEEIIEVYRVSQKKVPTFENS